jgi:hypothetical protein
VKFEEVLPALREGKAIQRTGQPVQWAYVKKSPNGAFHCYGYGDDPDRAVAWNIGVEELQAEDWAIVDEAEVKARKPAAEFVCGRRGDYGSDTAKMKPLDHWSMRDGRRTCSYCGSAHQDDVMAMAEAGTIQWGPTDKGYKAYLSLAPTDEDETIAKENAKKFGVGELIFKDKGEVAFEEWWQKERSLHVRGKDMGKFYFQHLTDAQKDRFLVLLNERKLKIGYPGHFYRLPYFIRYAE